MIPKLIHLAGPASANKTATARALVDGYRAQGRSVTIVTQQQFIDEHRCSMRSLLMVNDCRHIVILDFPEVPTTLRSGDMVLAVEGGTA